MIRDEDGKKIISVPKSIRYMSEWANFSLNFFNGPYIIDKQIPGCGFTEYCLTNDQNIILCSPRRILLENKESQHPGEIFYARNEFEVERTSVDNENDRTLDTDRDTSIDLAAKDKMRNNLRDYVMKRSIIHRPSKIIVTYDSFKYVMEFLTEMGIFKTFLIVVDEFQSIFIDSRFKAGTEYEFFNILRMLLGMNICFVSATPMLSKYLLRLEYFNCLPFYELDWKTEDPSRVMSPELKVRKIKSITSEVKRIINSYLNNEFSVLSDINGNIIQSKEAVFYLNSVNDILKIIKTMGLTPDQVNILCSDTEVNQKKMKRKLGKKYTIGTVPLRGEPHKMFTFCTRTVYLGADFYSTNARTFIFGDANIESLAVDISLDLPQILGRQRLVENPWKNHAEFYFKTIGKDKITREEFDNFVKEKDESTLAGISIFSNLTNPIEIKRLLEYMSDDIKFNRYSKNYISLNYIDGGYKPVINELVRLAEERAFDIQQVDYKDRFSVFAIIKGDGIRLDRIGRYIEHMRDTSIYISQRLKELCETDEFTEDEKRIIAQQTSEVFDKYYNLLGPERCKATGYDTTDMRKEIQDLLIPKDDIRGAILSVFKVGERYSKTWIKEKLRELYKKLGLNKTPKATDLENYFILKEVKVIDITTNTRLHGLEILGIRAL